jgi:hypothetical protein
MNPVKQVFRGVENVSNTYFLLETLAFCVPDIALLDPSARLK